MHRTALCCTPLSALSPAPPAAAAHRVSGTAATSTAALRPAALPVLGELVLEVDAAHQASDNFVARTGAWSSCCRCCRGHDDFAAVGVSNISDSQSDIFTSGLIFTCIKPSRVWPSPGHQSLNFKSQCNVLTAFCSSQGPRATELLSALHPPPSPSLSSDGAAAAQIAAQLRLELARARDEAAALNGALEVARADAESARADAARTRAAHAQELAEATAKVGGFSRCLGCKCRVFWVS